MIVHIEVNIPKIKLTKEMTKCSFLMHSFSRPFVHSITDTG